MLASPRTWCARRPVGNEHAVVLRPRGTQVVEVCLAGFVLNMPMFPPWRANRCDPAQMGAVAEACVGMDVQVYVLPGVAPAGRSDRRRPAPGGRRIAGMGDPAARARGDGKFSSPG